MKISRKTLEELGRLIPVKDAAGRMGVTQMRICQYVSEGLLDVVRMPGRILVDPDDLPKIKGQLKRRGRKKKIQ